MGVTVVVVEVEEAAAVAEAGYIMSVFIFPALPPFFPYLSSLPSEPFCSHSFDC